MHALDAVTTDDTVGDLLVLSMTMYLTVLEERLSKSILHLHTQGRIIFIFDFSVALTV